MSQGIAESAINVLDTLLELQQLLGGSATSFTEFVLYEAGSATGFTEFVLNEAESAVKLKVESTFDLLPNPIFCVVCNFMASLSNTMASPEEGSGILFLGFLEEVQAHPWHPVRFPIQHRHPHPKCFPQQCQGHSFGQTRIIIKSICFWISKPISTDS